MPYNWEETRDSLSETMAAEQKSFNAGLVASKSSAVGAGKVGKGLEHLEHLEHIGEALKRFTSPLSKFSTFGAAAKRVRN